MQGGFATYLHPETTATSKQPGSIPFVGFSWPYFSQVRQALARRLEIYSALPLRIADLELFGTVHTSAYLQQLRFMADDTPPDIMPRLSRECIGLEYCLPGYCASLGGMIEAIDRMHAGTLDRAYCFSLGGHHAYPDWGHGYCLLNPLAAAVRYAQSQGFERVLIVDWDHHHGDGTQAIFANDPTVYCVSIHSAADLYMASACGLLSGTTAFAEVIGQCNIPALNKAFDDTFFDQMQLPGHFYRAHEVLSVFQATLTNLPWQPDLICIFSGYDAHRDDCGRGISDWTDPDFGQLTRFVLDLAHQVDCPVLSVHGGGYNLTVTLNAAAYHVDMLADYRFQKH